jgi:hypothetical protein
MTCCPAQVDLLRLSVQEDLSCPGSLVLAVLSRLSCPGRLSWLSCPDCPAPRSCHETSCPPPRPYYPRAMFSPSCPVLVVLFCLSCPACRVLSALSGCPTLAVLCWLSCHRTVFHPVVVSRLFCLRCYFLAALSSPMSWLS